MKKSRHQFISEHKQEVEFRTDRSHAEFGSPQLSQSEVVYEIAEKTRAVANGGLALIHQIAVQSGLYDAINSIPVLKLHLPYSEADYLLNRTYNFLCGGTALEHIEYHRNDPVHLKMLGAPCIPDPTTAGDFCRRYTLEQIEQIQDVINQTRIEVWKQQGESFFTEAVVDRDGSITPTYGECKGSRSRTFRCFCLKKITLSNMADFRKIAITYC
jgi:hypothetical protein